MKLLRISSLFLLSLFALSTMNAAEVDILQQKAKFKGTNNYKCVGINKPLVKGNKTQSIVFTKMDSLANSLSYLNDKQTPFVWDPVNNFMVTIKRGSHEVSEPDYNSSNSKNNLFIRTSTDLGKTWAPSIKVYDKDFWKLGEARFPSIAVNFVNKKPFYYMTFALIIEAQGAWKGWGTGIYGDINGSDNSVWMGNEKFTANSKEYKWGQFYYTSANQPAYSASDSKITGWQKDGSYYVYAVGGVAPSPKGTLDDNGNFAYRKIVDFDESISKYVIPSAWSSSKFDKVDSIVYRPNEMIGMAKDGAGKMYFGAFGNFTGAKSDSSRNECAMSISNDNGDTWGEFEIFPFQLIRDFIKSQYSTKNPNDFFMPFFSKDLVVFDNGDYSYIVSLIESKTNDNLPGDRMHIALELYKENGVFGVRSITNNLSAGSVNLYNDDPTAPGFVGNSKDYELQASRSADGKYLLAKWVYSYSEWPTDSTFKQASTDIYTSLRDRGTNKWTTPKNITNDSDQVAIHFGVWIPNLLPNDKKNIVILECNGADNSTLQTQATYLKKQYVMIGHFDADNFTSVEDETIFQNELNVYPNPSNDKSTLTFSLNTNATLELTVTDMTGRVVYSQNGVNGQVGLNAIYLETKKLDNGVYFVNLNSANIKLTQKLNVIK